MFLFYPGMSLNSLLVCPRKMLKMSLKVLECPEILNKNLSGHQNGVGKYFVHGAFLAFSLFSLELH